jgi:hypothetical protein
MPKPERDAETLRSGWIAGCALVEVPLAFVGLFAATSNSLGLVGTWLRISIHRTDGLEGAAMASSSPFPMGRPVRFASPMNNGRSRCTVSVHQAKIGVTYPTLWDD